MPPKIPKTAEESFASHPKSQFWSSKNTKSLLEVSKGSGEKYFGCDLQFFKEWTSYRFEKNMNWDNLGTIWEFDHILPINIFNFNKNEEIKICFHWTNLQPLNKKENNKKSDKLHLHYYFTNIINIFRFTKIKNQFMDYQVVNESLQWLKIELRYGKNVPYDKATKIAFEIGNPQRIF